MKLSFFTQNEAPFRMRWMDELAKYMDVTVYHVGEYEVTINPEYISYHTQKATTVLAEKKILSHNFFDLSKVNDFGDLVLLDGYGFGAQVALAFKLIQKHISYGISIDGGFLRANENRVKFAIKKKIISNASYCLSTCEEADKILRHYGADDKNIYRHYFSNYYLDDVLPRTLSANEKNKLRQELSIDDVFTFISVGRVISRKNFVKFLRAEKYLQKDKDFQILIVGGTKEQFVELYGEAPSEHMKFVPFLDKTELFKYYQASDVFVLPTKHDVWGLVIGEAMACGLPVITTDKCLAGTQMILEGNNGYLVPVDDEKALAEKMNRIREQDLTAMSAYSLDVARKYAMDVAAREDAAVLRKLVY